MDCTRSSKFFLSRYTRAAQWSGGRFIALSRLAHIRFKGTATKTDTTAEFRIINNNPSIIVL